MSDFYALEKRVAVLEKRMNDMDERLSKSIKGGRVNSEKNALSTIVRKYLSESRHVTAEYLDGQSSDMAFGEFMGWCHTNGHDYPVDKGSKTVFSNTVRKVVEIGYNNAYFRLNVSE